MAAFRAKTASLVPFRGTLRPYKAQQGQITTPPQCGDDAPEKEEDAVSRHEQVRREHVKEAVDTVGEVEVFLADGRLKQPECRSYCALRLQYSLDSDRCVPRHPRTRKK